ncbi:LVIVD repeat-containing protein [Lutibaculum baratangense]|uniref:RNA polymerase subunit sigma-70 n=1 Tax=Lutibaculum baratangense AMV1 TaxID=631454 RepID=V4T7U9_9HYPH|nr:hypothetical protein [Lutibaculum baratangense]ESR22683.1 hypothetical protein N177_3820 [Lutibaculum baratangense AMV1]
MTRTDLTAAADGSAGYNVRRLGYLDIQGGGQVEVHRGHAFVGHMSPPDGTSIIDVRDPANPKVVATVAPPDQYSHTHKVRVVGDLMICNVERHKRHFYRKGERIAAVEEAHRARTGRDPGDAAIAAELGVEAADVPELRAGLERGYRDGGFRVFDISDLARPRELAYVHTGGIGVHRFHMDERYAYISTEMEGFVGNILVTYDLADPSAPKEVSRWWMPGQNVAAGETPDWPGQRHRLHHALRFGDRMFAACWYAGAWLVDVSDIAAPRTIGRFDYHPPIPEPTHTFMPVPGRFDGRELALACDEEHDHVPGQPHGFLWVLDITDPANIKPVSTFHVSERDSPYARAGGRFGIHQFREKMDGTIVHAAWFAGGLRVIDIADPARPTEIAAYVPPPPEGYPAPQSNDVDVDDRGLIYLLDRNRGLSILEHTG